jgi:hypothetical protein
VKKRLWWLPNLKINVEIAVKCHKAAQFKSKQMREERNELICNYCKKPGHVNSNCFKLMKKKQVEENGNGTKIGVAGTVTDIVLSSVESEKEIEMRFESEIACSMLRGQFQFMIFFRLFLELGLVCQIGM